MALGGPGLHILDGLVPSSDGGRYPLVPRKASIQANGYVALFGL